MAGWPLVLDIPWRERIAPGTDAAVAFILRKTGGVKAARELEADADLGHDTIRWWLYGNGTGRVGPGIKGVRRALNALRTADAPFGYDLAIVRRNDP